MQTLLYIIAGAAVVYLALSLVFTYLVQEHPRKPFHDPPDWGRVTDAMIPTAEGGRLEVWRVEPAGPSRGIVVLAHGWGRNRDRMVQRARHFGRWGFTCVIHSARDHGRSSPRRFMNAVRMAEDIQAVLDWVGAPLSLYRWFNPFFGRAFGPLIVFWMNRFYRNRLEDVSPARLAPSIAAPVMIVHGAADRRFPLAFAFKLKDCFAAGRVELFVAPNARHSESSFDPGYPGAVRGFIARHLEGCDDLRGPA